jgi:PAS domain S-box-containing protein
VSGSAVDLNGSLAYRMVLDAVPVACWIHQDGIVRYANPVLVRLLRLPGPHELLGRSVIELLPPDAHSVFELRTARLLAGHEAPRHEQELTVDGNPVSVEVVSSLITFDGRPAILTFFHDIREQRLAEAALRTTEVRYRRFLESEFVGVLEFSAAGIEDANDAFLNLIAYAREQLPGGRVVWRAISQPEDEEVDKRMLAHLLATGECQPFEKELVRRDGKRCPVLIGASLLEPAPDWRAIALVIDLTDRRKLQEIQQEKQRLKSIGILAAGMAHNLNNILTGVIGNASLLADQRLVPPNSRGADIAAEIVHAGERAATLTAQLLAYSGRGRFLVQPTSVTAVVNGAVDRIRPGLAPHIRLALDIGIDVPPVLADPGQLRHIVEALIENAIEAVGDREGGAVTVTTRLERLEDGAVLSRIGEPLPTGPYAVIEVRDNGAGMDSNTLAHAFDPFFSTKFPGRGLGLAAVSGIVRASKGAIRVSSSPGLGSVFQVYLPSYHALSDPPATEP